MRLPSVRFWISRERRAQVYTEILELSLPSWSYYARVAISTTIATYGLLANSTAVVIGAMLIAPLMGPILGIALGLSSGDKGLLRNSSVSEGLGALLAFGIAALAGLVPLNLGLGSEILARTEPTIYDLIVALASGLAGAYATVDERISAALPGVAISTALVPPLATAGLCLTGGHPDWALGALLLFLANFVAIQVASAGVFIAYGLPQERITEQLDLRVFLRRFGVSLGVLAIMAVFMTRTLNRLIEQRRLHESVETVLREQVRQASGASLSSVDFAAAGQGVDVVATVLTPQEFQPAQVGQIEDALRQRVRSDLRLVLRSLISKDFDRAGAVYLPEATRELSAAVERQTNLLRSATSVLTERLAEIPGARLAEVRREGDTDPVRLFALVRSPLAIDPSQVAEIQTALAERIGTPVALLVRTVAARDADAARFIYDGASEQPAQTEDLERRRRIEALLRQGLASQPGVSLGEVHEFSANGRTLIHAEIRSPRPLEPGDVARVQKELRRGVSPALDLVVRYALGADVSANGLASFADGETPRIPAPWESDRFRDSLHFSSGSAQLSADARAALGQVAVALRDAGDVRIAIRGYSDDRGPREVRRAISLARAKAVQAELVRRGVPLARTSVEALDARDPDARSVTEADRARSRRVELEVAQAPTPSEAAGPPPPADP